MGALSESRTAILAQETVVAQLGGCPGGTEDTRIGQDPRDDYTPDSHIAQRVIENTRREGTGSQLVHNKVLLTRRQALVDLVVWA